MKINKFLNYCFKDLTKRFTLITDVKKDVQKDLDAKINGKFVSFFHFNAHCYFQTFKYFNGINVITKPLIISDVKKGHEDLAGQIDGIFVIYFLRIFLTITTFSIYSSKYYL